MYRFNSDYLEGAHPNIIERLVKTNFIQTPGYGLDPISDSAKEKIRIACNAPDAKVYFCSIESSKWSNNYTKSFTTAPEVNAAVSAFADECDWLGYVNTRYIFCDDEQKVVYTDGDGNADDNDDTGIYGQGSHPSVVAYDEYKKAIDAVRGKSADD